MISTAPELLTDRLRLRAHRREDTALLALLWQDPLVMQHFGGEAMPDEDIWNRLLRYLGHWVANGFGMWAMEERATGAYVGDVGLFEGRRGLGERFDTAPEAGWMLVPAAHGRGFAQEGMRAALEWGAERYGWPRTVCMIDGANLPSIRTAESLGYQAAGEGTYRGKTIALFERYAADFADVCAGA